VTTKSGLPTNLLVLLFILFIILSFLFRIICNVIMNIIFMITNNKEKLNLGSLNVEKNL